MADYYYALNGQQAGPVPEEQLTSLLQTGTINASTLVWRDGMADWQPLSTVLGPVAAAVPAQPPPASFSTPGEATQVCAVSGRSFPVSQMVKFGDVWVAGMYRDQYLQRLREGAVSTGRLNLAGIGTRFVASFIDGLILQAVQFVIGMALGVVMASAASPEAAAGLAMLNVVLALAIGFSYEAFFLAAKGATPGKMAMKIRVVRPDGSKISMGQAWGRTLGKQVSALILMIGYLMAFWDEEKRSLHDRMAGTRVIKL